MHMNLDYGATLSRAWRITWNNKGLWLLGILAALGAGGGGSRPNLNFRGGPGPNPIGQPDPRMEELMRRLFGDVDPNVLVAVGIGLACLVFLIGVLLFVLSIIGRGGLIGGIQIADAQGKASFGEGWRIGTRKFWTVLGIGLIVWLISLVIGLASGLAFLTICLAPLACIGFLLIAVLSVYTLLAQVAAVVDDLPAMAALSKAWQVVQANLAGVIVLGLILIVINFVFSFLVATVTAALIGPAFVGAVIAGQGENPNASMAFIAVGALCLTALIPVLIVIGGVVQTWVTAVWTLAYKHFTGRAGAVVTPAAPPAPAM
jgi:hypothetical protein